MIDPATVSPHKKMLPRLLCLWKELLSVCLCVRVRVPHPFKEQLFSNLVLTFNPRLTELCEVTASALYPKMPWPHFIGGTVLHVGLKDYFPPSGLSPNANIRTQVSSSKNNHNHKNYYLFLGA